MERFSFWKPDPLPVNDGRIIPTELLPLGEIDSVSKHLMDIPRMRFLWCPPTHAYAEFCWEVGGGVFMKASVERTILPGKVVTISAEAIGVPRNKMWHLYSSMWEHFGSIILDEEYHEFVMPLEFKRMYV